MALVSIIFSNLYYTGIFSWHLIELSARDDFESLSYVGLFLVHADLPWRNDPKYEPMKRSIKRIKGLKAKWTGAELGAGSEPEFGDLLDYSCGLGFCCLPDYEMWKARFAHLALHLGVVWGETLDWTPEALPASIPQLSVSSEALDIDDALDEVNPDSSKSNLVTAALTQIAGISFRENATWI